MEDTDDRNIKAEIDEIAKKVNAIIKNINDLDPAKQDDLQHNENE